MSGVICLLPYSWLLYKRNGLKWMCTGKKNNLEHLFVSITNRIMKNEKRWREMGNGRAQKVQRKKRNQICKMHFGKYVCKQCGVFSVAFVSKKLLLSCIFWMKPNEMKNVKCAHKENANNECAISKIYGKGLNGAKSHLAYNPRSIMQTPCTEWFVVRVTYILWTANSKQQVHGNRKPGKNDYTTHFSRRFSFHISLFGLICFCVWQCLWIAAIVECNKCI